MIVRLQAIQGYALKARDGWVGKIQDFYFDDEFWVLRYLVVETSAWLLQRRSVLISPSVFSRQDEEHKIIFLNITQEQIRKSPAADTAKPISRQYEEELSRHYQWSAYWATPLDGVFDRGDRVYPATPSSRTNYLETRTVIKGKNHSRPEDSHLRSAVEIKKYKIHTLDGELGKAEDFIAENVNWKMRYLEIRTGPLWSRSHILLDVHWITDISWDNKRIDFNLSRQAIQTAPAYDPALPVTEEYEQQLTEHYRPFIES